MGLIAVVVIIVLIVGIAVWYFWYSEEEEDRCQSQLSKLRSYKESVDDIPSMLRLYITQVITEFPDQRELLAYLKYRWGKSWIDYFNSKDSTTDATTLWLSKFQSISQYHRGEIDKAKLNELLDQYNSQLTKLYMFDLDDQGLADKIRSCLNRLSNLSITQYNLLKSGDDEDSQSWIAYSNYQKVSKKLFSLTVASKMVSEGDICK